MNFFKKVLNIFGGGLGRNSYENAQITPSRGTPQNQTPTDEMFVLDSTTRTELMRRARWCEKNSGIILSVLKDFKIYGVGRGVYPTPQTDDAKWNKSAYEYFFRWAKSPDYSGRFSWREMQCMAVHLKKIDGEFFAIKCFDAFGSPKIQLIEAHRLGGCIESHSVPNGHYVSDGIEFNKNGKVAAYHFRVGANFETKRYPASAVIHVFEATRPSASRAHSEIQHSINEIIDRKEIVALEKKKVKAISDVVGVIKGSSKGPSQDFSIAGTESESSETDIRTINRIMGGKNLRIGVDETYEFKTPTSPSSTFNGFTKDIDRMAHLGIEPYEMTNPSEIGGAGVRLICAKTQRYIDAESFTLDEKFYSKVWFFVIGWAINNGELPPIKWWWDANWTHPKRLTVDAGRDGQNERADIDMGLKSIRQNYTENGLSFEDEMESRAKDFALMKEIAKRNGIDFSLLYKPNGSQVILTNQNEDEK